MKRKRATPVVLLVLLGLGLAAPALAIFGFGDIVFDPSNYQQAVQQLAQMQQQYAQLVATYNMIRSQYEHLVRMARQVPVNMAGRYRALATSWLASSATNIYGTTGGWITGINTGLNVAAGYSQATQSLGAYGAALGNIPADQLQRLKTGYATVELTDGANLSGMETLGRLRASAQAVENTIRSLEDDSLSADPAMNTEIAVLNKINAANLISIRSAQDGNKLLVALAEAQLIEAKRKRDAEAQAFNSHIRFMAEGKAAMEAQATGASEAMRAWRMP